MGKHRYGPLSAIPVGETKRHLPLSRREFLGGLAATPAISGISTAFAATEPDDSGLNLRFDLSDDGHQLRVERVDPKTNEPASGRDPLKLSTEMFGQDSWFDIAPPQPGTRNRTLFIRNVTYGDLTGKKIVIFFENTKGWKIRIKTDVWLASTGNSLEYHTEHPVSLENFLAGSVRATEILWSSRVSQTLSRMFDGRIDASHDKSDVEVALDCSFHWHLRTKTKPFKAFAGQIAVVRFRLGWHQPRETAATEGQPGNYFGGFGDVASVTALSAGNAAGLHFRLLEPKPAIHSGWQLEIRRGPSALLPKAEQTVSRLVVGSSTAEFADGIRRVAGTLKLRQLVATETAVTIPGHDRIVRTVFSASGSDADASETAPAEPSEMELMTPVGRIRATLAFEDRDTTEADEGVSAAPAEDDFAKLALAAVGDRTGAPGQTTWLVADRGVKAGATQNMRRVAVGLLLLEADTALPDVSHSRLLFEHADLRLSYADGLPLEGPIAEAPTAEASSFIWLGRPAKDARHASFDLSRATLVSARDYDQMRLRFRFSDMALAFAPLPVIVPTREDCGVTTAPTEERADISHDLRRGPPEPVRVDTRPVLVVEFDPQHIMEEAIFRPELPPLPDIGLDEPLPGPGDNESAWRDLVQKRKKDEEKSQNGGQPGPFALFCDKFKAASETEGLSAEQRIYVGPDGLDPDAYQAARKLQALSIDESIKLAVIQLIDVQAVQQIIAIQASEAEPGGPPKPLPEDDGLRLELEQKLESTLPLYSLFRGFYRDLLTGNSKMTPAEPATGADNDGEYFHPNNRNGIPAERLPLLHRRSEDARAKFVLFASGRDPVPDIVEARLSGPTRLAFRVNCRPGAGDSHDANGLPASPAASDARPGSAGMAFGAMPFTFRALTDWSHHEPAVTRRAEKLFHASRSGIVPPLGEQAADLDDHRMLGHQGLSEGEEVTGEQRMSEIRASLAQGPTSLETAIEIPSRLILSTAQDAVWQTTRRFPIPHDTPEFSIPAAKLEHGETPESINAPILTHSRDLWTARLLIDDMLPGLRVVDTPDFRAMAMKPSSAGGDVPLPGHFAPPRGAFAPWFLGAQQANAGASSARAAHISVFPADEKPGQTDDQFCKEAKDFPAPKKLRLVDWLCRRLGIRTDTDNDIKYFRTSLDAYDRHELMMLTSAYGLPVTGKRRPVGENVELAGALIDGSGQFEPGKTFALLDGRADEAIYRPVPLSATELTLSTLGGSFTHDTHFNPPATALDIYGRPFFSGASIERWQHHIVLGRDIRTEVVYKGYLFPLGHRASLVKLTERVFLLTKNQGYKALLRQRMFLRLGKPNKKYPAVGQPNSGRQWCANDVLMLTRVTPDIVDPTTPPPGGSGVQPPTISEDANGALRLTGLPGLAFWPKTDLTDGGRVEFQFELDGKQTSMPLLFLDNVAATTPETVRRIAEYYNLPTLEKHRTMRFRGQKLRYAEEVESGDTTFATDHVIVQVQGRNKPGGTMWGGDNSLYEPTGVLEGAEQPPFYPAVDKASIHIEQVERFTGSAADAREIRYDGYFLENGLPSAHKVSGSEGQQQANGNPLEVFLNLISSVDLNMGGSGDRSGGIARPNSKIYALSRSKGPLGADNPDYQVRPGVGNIATGIVSLAEYFRKAVPPRPTAVTTTTVQSSGDQPPDNDQLKVFQNFFTGDAKLLGIIRLKDLMALFDLAGADLPLLKETMEFGAALQDAASDALSLVRVNVLLPLKGVTEKIGEQWDALDKQLAEQQMKLDGKAKVVSIKTYFPEIDDGLNDLGKRLDLALAENDLLKLPSKLSAIYEAGKRFARLLATLAANAPERLQEAVRDKLLNGISGILGTKAALEQALTQISAIGASDPKAAIAFVVKKLIASANILDEYLPLPVPAPDLIAAVRSAGDAAGDTAADIMAAEVHARAILNLLYTGMSTSSDGLVKLITETITSVAAGNLKLDEAAKSIAIAFIDAAEKPIDDALTYIGDNVTGAYKAQLLGAVAVYHDDLEKTKGHIAGTDKGTFPPLSALSQLFVELRDLAASGEQIRILVNAVGNDDIDATLAAFAVISRQMFGIEYDLAAILASPATNAASAIDDLARFLGFVKGGFLRWPTDDEVTAADTKPLPDKLPSESLILKKIASAWSEMTSISDQIAAAKADFDEHRDDLTNDLQLAVEGVLTDTTELGDKLKAEIGVAYRHFVRLGRGLQIAHRSLQDVKNLSIGDGAEKLNIPVLMQRLEIARMTVARAVDGLSLAFTNAAEAFENYVKKPNNAKVIQGIFALALTDSAEIKQAFTELEGTLKASGSTIVDGLMTVIGTTLRLLKKGSLLAVDGIEAVKKSLSELPAVFDPDRTAVVAALDKLATKFPNELVDDFDAGVSPETFAQMLVLKIKSGGETTVEQFFLPQGSDYTLDKIRAGLRDAETEMVDAFRKMLDRASAVPQALLNEAYALVKPIFGPMAEGYRKILISRDTLYNDPSIAQGLASALVLDALVVDEDPSFPCGTNPCDRLNKEVAWITAVAAAPDFSQPEVRQHLQDLLDGWLNTNAAPLVIFEKLKKLVVNATSGDILSMIDIAALRDEIEDILSNLVPLRTTLAYDLNLATGSHGASESSKSIFSLKEGSRFDVAVRVDIDLLGNKPVKFRADGKLGAFRVNLLGGLFDAVALDFNGASFLIEDGGKPSFDVDYNTFEIGKELEFAQKLQSFLSPGGSGFYLQPLEDAPGIEAGYGLNLGTIQLGGMSFSNVSLNVAALLPFTDREAQFRASLARRLAPFTISVPPFGGAGFFAITANARTIVGFEASFEFGGSADFSFGPLTAYGRIMSGFYIRTQELQNGERITELSGTFFAGGAASIWIFNFYASLYVKLAMVAGGAMEGEAIFSFSFSMGIVDYDYSIRASSKQKAMGNTETGSAEMLNGPTRFALAAPDGVDTSIITGSIITPEEYGFITGVRATTVCQAKDSSKYRDYFDLSLLEKAS